MSDTPTASVSQAQGAFTAQVNGRPNVFTVQGQTAHSVLSLDPAEFGFEGADAGAYLSPDGTHVAYSVTDASQLNPVVRVFKLADGSTTELIKYSGGDRLTCFTWKPDGSALSFMRTSPAEDPSQPYICQIWSVPAQGGSATQLYGDDVLQFLGWSSDSSRIYLTRRLKGLFSYSILTVASNQFQDVFLPNTIDNNQTQDIIGLTFRAGTAEAHLGYVLNSSPYLQNSPSTPVRVVDANTVAIIKEINSDGAATNLTFSDDQSLLAFSSYKFPSGTDPSDAASEALSGVQVLTVADGTVRPLIAPEAGAGTYSILAWAGDNSGLFVGTADGGVRFVDFEGNAAEIVAASEQGQSVGGSAGVQALGVSNAVVNIDVPYIHQLKMTPPDFDGNWACGPTSATMIGAYYGKLTPRNDTFEGNFTQYGWYVSSVFNSNANGYTFNRMQADASGHAHGGAYGQSVDGGEAYAWRVVDYLQRLGLAAVFRASVSTSMIKDYLNAGKPIVLSTNLHGFGHLVCLKGYTSDGRWIVNDPYWAKPGAGQIVYSWGDFQGPPWMITIDTDAPTASQPSTPTQPTTPTTPTQPSTPTTPTQPATPPAAPQVGAGNDALKSRFQADVDRLGGVSQVGQPTGNVYVYNQRSMQEFKGGSLGDGILVADERFDRAGDHPVATVQPVFGVFGTFLSAWRDSYGGSGGTLGSPLSDAYVNGQNNLQQNFEGGYILLQGQTSQLQGAFPWPTGFNAWKAEYFNNTGLAGKPSFTRDETPNASGGFAHNWGTGAPDNGQIGLGVDNFSARYSRSINFGDGATYNFVVTADDGFRITVDGQNLAGATPDQYWQISGPTPHTFRVAVGGGVHTIVVEYFEAGGGAQVELDINHE